MKKINKKANLVTSVFLIAVVTLVILTILFEAFAVIMPLAQDSGDNLNESNQCVNNAGGFWNTTQERCTVEEGSGTILQTAPGAVPLNALFSGTGIVFIVIMAALLILVVKGLLGKKK